ncbi:THO complex subunit 4B-like isoform X3 [Camellia sinensis]|uniref:THO complex subunit 4B-like isoform X3 n=1 Tax=Camellia sinensis TaxID=4442 RepID=UPI001036BE88|nr:THO complex subunit 4B-like isoform X3 [Camellia sinensis]
MSQALDMSLDDIIRNNKKSGGSNGNFRGRGRGRGFVSGPGPARRFPNRAPTRTTPYLIPQMVQVQQMLAMGGSGSESATKLYVSNLDYGVSNDDLKVLFSEVGEVKRHSIHYDRSGRSKGTAEVVFTRQSDALTAVERYNNVQLDGKPMKIELVGVNIVTPPAPPTTNGILGNPSGNFRSIMCLPISVKDSSKRGEISGLFRTMTGK